MGTVANTGQPGFEGSPRAPFFSNCWRGKLLDHYQPHSSCADRAMPINRMLWKYRILSEDSVPDWPCPSCGMPTLQIVPGSFRTILDRKSRFLPDHEYHPMAMTGRFICLLECSKCAETCSVSGNYDTDQDYDVVDGEPTACPFERGHPRSITPPPPMIQIPKECPKEIRREIVAAFALFWADNSSSLNRIRIAIELLLTELGVRRQSAKQGKRTRLSLDSRIQILRSEKTQLSDLCDRLLAVKHLGNAGSHPGDVKEEDVFDGFDILERVLHDIYSDIESILSKMVREINRRKGPRKR